MKKDEIVKKLSEKLNITQVESKRIFDSVFDVLTDILSKGNTFTETGFGTFSVVEINKRKGFNPLIHKWMMLPPKLKPKFRASEHLKEEVNKRR
ncbi:MAG TPA: HU family DNA-binding protein [Spirochaetota bacterium]|nr:HU family DNA-binding protein [Spirochaetota bacterium]